MGAEEKLKQIEEKLKKLKELKRKIEQKAKREKELALKYAKELAFCWAEHHKDSENKLLHIMKCLRLKFCKRAKNKNNCLERKLKLIVEHKEQFRAIYELAELLLQKVKAKS